jgi:hypothetical protein
MKVRKLFSGFFAIILVISVILYLNKIDDALGIYPHRFNRGIAFNQLCFELDRSDAST